MKLKTYTAETMAQALAQVRKELGKDAMILHTRSYRVGSWLGLGGKNMVEITASSPTPASTKRQIRSTPRVAQPAMQTQPSQPEIVVQRGRTVTRQRLEPVAVGGQHTERAQHTPQQRGSSHQRNSGDATPDLRGLNGRDALFDDAPSNKTKVTKRDRPKVTDAAGIERKADRPLVSVMTDQLPSPRKQSSANRTPPTENMTIDQAIKPPRKETNTSQADENAELRSQLACMQKMMGQVLESTRKTAVAVETGKSDAALPSGEMPGPLFSMYSKLIDNDTPVDLADRIVGQVRDRLDALELNDPMVVRQSVLREIERTIRTRSESLLTLDHISSTGRPRIIALVGPTGVGKTTTVAKLAATYKLRHQKRVGLITSDTYRIAAVEQLKTYAGIIGLPLKVANTPQEMSEAIDSLHECDIVVIDTAGRSQNNQRRLDELAEFAAAAAPDETHLVLSTTVGDNVLRKTAERFRALGPDRCILTKLDEAVTTGPIAGLCDRIGLPLSFVTLGQEVPDDLEPARADRLARCVLDGPDAVLRREDEENG